MSDTPETDAMWEKFMEFPRYTVTSSDLGNLARRLERERDYSNRRMAEVVRWIERNQADGFIDSKPIPQQLDDITDRLYGRAEKAERERDQSREEASRLRDSFDLDQELPWEPHQAPCWEITRGDFGNDLVCTLPEGHPGPHEAQGRDGTVFKRWESEEEKP